MNKKYFRQPLGLVRAILITLIMCSFSKQSVKASGNLVSSAKSLSVGQRVSQIRQQISLSSKDVKRRPAGINEFYSYSSEPPSRGKPSDSATTDDASPWPNWNNV